MLLAHESFFTFQFLPKFGGRQHKYSSILPLGLGHYNFGNAHIVRSCFHGIETHNQLALIPYLIYFFYKPFLPKLEALVEVTLLFNTLPQRNPLLSIVCVFHLIFKSCMEYMCFYHINGKYGTTFKKNKLERFQFASNCLELYCQDGDSF